MSILNFILYVCEKIRSMSCDNLLYRSPLTYGLIAAGIFLIVIVGILSTSTDLTELISQWQFKVFLCLWIAMIGVAVYGLRHQYLLTIEMARKQYPGTSRAKSYRLGQLFYRQKYFKGFALTLALFPLAWIVFNFSLPTSAMGVAICIACIAAAIILYLSIPYRHR